MERNKNFWFENMDSSMWTPDFPRCSIFEQMAATAKKYPQLPAIEFQNKKYSFSTLLDIIDKLSEALLSIGIKNGDIVSIITPNTPQGVFMFYAVNKIGAVANMIHPLLSSNEMQNFIETTESTAVFVMDVIYDKIADISWNIKKPHIIIGKVADALPMWMKPLYNLKQKKKLQLNQSQNNIIWSDLLKSVSSRKDYNEIADSTNDQDISDKPAVILYSGGTTGTQKGVMLTNYNFTCYAIQAFEASGMDTVGKKCLTVLPLFHGFGIALCVHTMLYAGTCIYLVPVYDFNKCNSLIFKKKLNFICGVPSLFETLSRHPKFETEDLSFIECLISGGDVLPPKLQKRINKQLKAGGSKAEIREAYGQTESVTGCCINPCSKNVIGSVGIPCPDIDSKIVEIGTTKAVPNGADGELCLSGPNIMLGYYKNESATKTALKLHDDGKIWLHTGDIFYKRDDGYLFFRQRMTRMIVCSGYNIYLSQVEDCVSSCEIVEQSCAVGIIDNVLGSKVGLYVILKDGVNKESAHDIIMEHCRKHLAEYSLPQKIIFTDDFPKTKMGKTDFRTLENKINSRLGEDQ